MCPECKIDTSIREILIEVYRFPCDVDITKARVPSLVFNRKRVGLRRYHAAYTATSKSFNRLIMKQLATRGSGRGFRCGCGVGIKLTQAGGVVAEELRQRP